MSRVLVVGWFSFELMGSTAGDVIAKDVVCSWLRDAGLDPIVAMHRPQAPDEVATEDVDPRDVATLVFVCGPVGDGPPLNAYLDRFRHARRVAVNVTLLQDLADWNPFDHVVERDSRDRVNADITFVAARRDVPVVGLVMVGDQDEYATNRHGAVEAAFDDLIAARDVAVLAIDTRLDLNAGGLRTAAEVESVIARTDAVLTTRLHGAAIALRRGVPAVAVDSVPGGSKLLAQMRHIGWPLAFDVADLHRVDLGAALDRALSEEGRELARATAQEAARQVVAVREEFISAVVGSTATKSGR
jgi:hypothetical protein